MVERLVMDSSIHNCTVDCRPNNSSCRVVLSTDIEGLETLSREEIK